MCDTLTLHYPPGAGGNREEANPDHWLDELWPWRRAIAGSDTDLSSIAYPRSQQTASRRQPPPGYPRLCAGPWECCMFDITSVINELPFHSHYSLCERKWIQASVCDIFGLCANTPSLSLDGALGNGKMASTGTDAFTDPVISLLSLHKTGANGSFMECFGGSFSPWCTLWRCCERQLISVESINNIMHALSQWPAKRFSTISPQISVTSKCFLTSFFPKTKGCK